jgi:hypothetical protein
MRSFSIGVVAIDKPVHWLNHFEKYPKTRAALHNIRVSRGELGVRSAARTIQLIARVPITGDYLMTSAEAEQLTKHTHLTEEIRSIIEVYLSETNRLPGDGLGKWMLQQGNEEEAE